MPHIVIKEPVDFYFPVKKDEFKFLWIAKPFLNAKDSLVGVLYKDFKFLITIKKSKKDELIIKCDKITRPSQTTIAKKVLKSFCEIFKCQIVRTNISNIKEHHLKRSKDFLKDINFFIDKFPKDKEVWIEIGFGSGRHLIYQAKKNPDTLFIGIEIYKPSIEQVLKQIQIQKIKNIFLIDYDARLFLEFVPSNRVGKIFIHFPVPWDKKPHRRVVSKKFIQEIKRVLKVDGTLELRTDSKNYFDYSLGLFLEEDRVKLEVDKNIDVLVSSKYEDRWKRLKKDIFDLKFFNLEESKELKIDFDFEFKKEFNIEKIIKNFDIKPKVFDDFFIHFEKMYKIDKNRALLKLSFGNFDKPEHRYILIDENKASYFPKKPIISRANIDAHKKIEELLNG